MGLDERLITYLRGIHGELEHLRERLRLRYGWTHIELSLDIEPLTPTLIVTGEIAVPSLRAAVVATLTPLLLDDMQLELDLRPMPVREWYAVPDAGLELWAQHPSCPKRSLATELEADDGPVGHLAHDGPGMLLRARDGTIGWATGLLGPAQPPRPLVAPSPDPAGARICEAARSYLGIPYRLGGASTRQIDCSALVQRAYDRALHLLLPRHSHDQLAACGGGQLCGSAIGTPGDLLFIHSRTMQRLHVGIVGPTDTIIHASRSRGMVIEAPQVEFQLDAEWLRRGSTAALLDWGRAQAQREHVELPLRGIRQTNLP
ncbi:C40 family peptidase [Enhygromyxa salina]|uniref:Murein DD-endopeptidase MepS/Murein LD-carboxypeptidase n=1 Tax=Enhygromyxa salina TaxID=215803 RepID=A0A2S9Y7U7_9BACT|nr:NlpC/P60 family protein [Enhygromyxa salina]PRQ01184.1 Murein DD-endopeptidase MepS/Murein LD-carboxypeptidase precursor [Enhygromyxa salina]